MVDTSTVYAPTAYPRLNHPYSQALDEQDLISWTSPLHGILFIRRLWLGQIRARDLKSHDNPLVSYAELRVFNKSSRVREEADSS